MSRSGGCLARARGAPSGGAEALPPRFSLPFMEVVALAIADGKLSPATPRICTTCRSTNWPRCAQRTGWKSRSTCEGPMARHRGPVLVDTNVILECWRIKAWRALGGGYGVALP